MITMTIHNNVSIFIRTWKFKDLTIFCSNNYETLSIYIDSSGRWRNIIFLFRLEIRTEYFQFFIWGTWTVDGTFYDCDGIDWSLMSRNQFFCLISFPNIKVSFRRTSDSAVIVKKSNGHLIILYNKNLKKKFYYFFNKK